MNCGAFIVYVELAFEWRATTIGKAWNIYTILKELSMREAKPMLSYTFVIPTSSLQNQGAHRF